MGINLHSSQHSKHLSFSFSLKAFSAALRSASRRTDDTGGRQTHMKPFAKTGSTSGEDTSTSGFARYHSLQVIFFFFSRDD